MVLPLLVLLIPTVNGCLPTSSPDDLVEITTVTSTVATTTPDNSMCQLCMPNPVMCRNPPPVDGLGVPLMCNNNGGVLPTITRNAANDGCSVTVSCFGGGSIYVYDSTNMWTQIPGPNPGVPTYTGSCLDSNPVWTYLGNPIQNYQCYV